MLKIVCEKEKLEKALRVTEVCTGAKGDPSAFIFMKAEMEVPAEGDPKVQVYLFSGPPRRPQTRVLLETTSVEETGVLSLEAWRLRQWLNATSGQEVSLSLQEKNVHVSMVGKKGEVRLPCSPIADVIFLEEEWLRSSISTEMEKAKLLSMLRYAKSFCDVETETTRPTLAVVDVHNQRMWASRGVLCTILHTEDLGNADFVIYAGHVSAAVSFLATVPGSKIQIREDPGDAEGKKVATFLSTEDGQVLALPWFAHRFPHHMFKDKELEQLGELSWTVDTKELKEAIKGVTASSPMGNDLMTFSYSKGEDLALKVPSVSGGEDEVFLSLTEEGTPEVSTFDVQFKLGSFMTVLDQHRHEQFKLELFPKDSKSLPGKGKIAVRFEYENCNYLTFQVWGV